MYYAENCTDDRCPPAVVLHSKRRLKIALRQLQDQRHALRMTYEAKRKQLTADVEMIQRKLHECDVQLRYTRKKMNDRNLYIGYLYVFQDRSLHDIATAMGLSTPRVREVVEQYVRYAARCRAPKCLRLSPRCIPPILYSDQPAKEEPND